MFARILVTLDGSPLAETALEAALAIAAKFASEVVLLRAVAPAELELSAGQGPSYFELKRLWENQETQAAECYLRHIRAQWRELGVRLRLEVALGAPPDAIIATANQLGADLIVMATHGRSGFNRLVYGSVAEAVLRAAEVPVMLVPIRSTLARRA
jgi:nucleotide-binding universal stress UspA family protein